MKHIKVILLILSLSIHVFAGETNKLVYIGKNAALDATDLKRIDLEKSHSAKNPKCKLINQQQGKWEFEFDIPVELYVIIRCKSGDSDEIREDKLKVGGGASLKHNFMLSRGVYRMEIPLSGDATEKSYFEEYSCYNHHNEVTKEVTTNNVGILSFTTTMTTSRGSGISGTYRRNFNELTEDESNTVIEEMFNQDISIEVGKECQIYKISKGDRYISLSILFVNPDLAINPPSAVVHEQPD